MLVISDTSPLNYLILVDVVEVLPKLYGRIIVPGAVALELSSENTPAKAKAWFEHHPSWIEVHAAAPLDSHPELDAGESQAIALAKALKADLLLMDERRGTAIARGQEKLNTTGTLGVLLDAAGLGLIDLPKTLERLQNETTFRAPPSLFQGITEEFKRRSGVNN